MPGRVPDPSETFLQTRMGDERQCVWVLQSYTKPFQGTGFMLDAIGLVTCSHVVKQDLRAHRSGGEAKRYGCSPLYQEADAIDLAVMRFDNVPARPLPCLRIGNSDRVQLGDTVRVLGFPNYRDGDSVTTYERRIAGTRNLHSIKRFQLDGPIIFGMSGGPVLNLKGEVVGIASRGVEDLDEGATTEKHTVIPVRAIERFGAAVGDFMEGLGVVQDVRAFAG